MKNLKPRGRLSAEETLRVVAAQTPGLPPASVEPEDGPTTLNLRLRRSTVNALAAKAHSEGLTQKQVVCHALAASGIAVAPADLEDRTPRRK